jgi:nitroreductase
MSDSAFASLTEIIRSRRSIKPDAMDPDRSMDANLLSSLLENATWAPTHGLTQPWRFHVFTGPARTQLAAQLQDLYRQLTPSAEQREDKLTKLGKNPLLAPVIIALSAAQIHPGSIPMDEEIQATACAAQNLMLTATALGLGSFWSSPPLIGSQAFSAWLQQLTTEPEPKPVLAWRCIGLIYLGWPKADLPAPTSTRTPITRKTTWV